MNPTGMQSGRKSKNIALLVQLPRKVSPGQRFRFEQYEHLLESNGYHLKTFSFFDENTRKILYKEGYKLQKFIGVVKGFLKRFLFLFQSGRYNYILLQREAAPVGFPFFEWVLAKVLRKKIIHDFDDAIWIPSISANNRLALSLKAFWKVKHICRWSYKVSVGNKFLGKWASDYNSAIVYNPTCVDMENRYTILKNHDTKLVTIGWTGSHSTLKYLDPIVPVLKKLEQEYRFSFLVICDREPEWKLDSLRFLPWNEKTEIQDLLEINIGIMPLEDDDWSEGKCGFKLIQYLALGIPAVASPVGVNKEIVEGGINGFLCRNESEWKESLQVLLTDASLRADMGAAGHQKMKEHFSVASNSANFLSLFS